MEAKVEAKAERLRAEISERKQLLRPIEEVLELSNKVAEMREDADWDNDAEFAARGVFFRLEMLDELASMHDIHIDKDEFFEGLVPTQCEVKLEREIDYDMEALETVLVASVYKNRAATHVIVDVVGLDGEDQEEMDGEIMDGWMLTKLPFPVSTSKKRKRPSK